MRVHLRRLCTASVEHLAQYHCIHSIKRSDGDNAGLRFPAVPFVPDHHIYPLADDLKDDPAVRLFKGVEEAFAPIDAGRKFPRRFPHGFQRKRLCERIAPCAENLRVVTPAIMKAMPAIVIATVRRMTGILDRKNGIELQRIKPTHRQQDLQGHVPVGCLDKTVAVEAVVDRRGCCSRRSHWRD